MEAIEMKGPPFSSDVETSGDFCDSMIARFSDSQDEGHQSICAVIGTMSQELKDQKFPSTPVAYFGATCSSLDRLLSDTDTPSHVLNSLFTILSIAITRIPDAILRNKRELVSSLVLQLLRPQSLPGSSAVPGLRCVSYLLIKRDSVNWSDISQLYRELLRFMTDSRKAVRRESHVCLRDSLLSFRSTSLLPSASEGICNEFERFLLLAGSGKEDSNEGAQRVMYILDALKECLPLMSKKSATTVLMHFRKLLDLHQPLVTRRINDALNLFCLETTSEVSPEALRDLLISLAEFVSKSETSQDGIAFTASLLSRGMNKLYSLDREICVVKLPLVFSVLKDILASSHKEAVYATTDAFKSLIHSCIDERLVKQGVDQISANANMEVRRSAPTIIEKICAILESLLDYHFSDVWDRAFQVVSAMFMKLGDYSSYFLTRMLKNLADIQRLPDEDFPFRKQLQECLGDALVAMGPEAFLSVLPLDVEAEDISKTNVWLFPILKQHTVGASLRFFVDSILANIRCLQQKSKELEQQGHVLSSRTADSLIYSLWSLLPSFCNYPLDTAESFKDLVITLCHELYGMPDVRGIICSSLQILIQQNKKILEGKGDTAYGEEHVISARAKNYYTLEVATRNLNALRSCGRELLSSFSQVFLNSSKDDGGCLQSAIGEIASISDKGIVSKHFKIAMKKLLKATEEAFKAESSMQLDESSNNLSSTLVRARLFDLAVSMLPGLNAEEIDLLFKAIKPALAGQKKEKKKNLALEDEGSLQKKAYKVLSLILQHSEEFLSSNFEELLEELIVDKKEPPCHFSAKRHRLDCLYFLIVHASKNCLEQGWHGVVTSFLVEIILALKEANKKTRNRAYDILVQIGHACGDEESGGKKEYLCQLFYKVAGCLTGETPHMISAAVKGLARLAYEFSDLVSTACDLLPSTFVLIQGKNREIIKANLGLLKVLVAKSQTEWLQMHLGSMVEALLKWQDNTKVHFKAKVKVLLEMLVKKCGLEAVKAVMPEEHMKLLTNIRKVMARNERKQGANSEETESRISKATSRQSKWNHSKIFSDFDEESGGSVGEYMSVKTVSVGRGNPSSVLKSKASLSRSKKGASKNLSEQLEDGPLNLLDMQRTRSALKSSEHLKRKSMLDDDLEMDSEGRLIIHEEGAQMKKRHADSNLDLNVDTGEPDSHLSGKPAKTAQKRRKTSDSGWAYTGSEYASKKAGGDVKRENKLEPYAYWPLDRKMMSRRPEHRAAARKGMARVVRLTKKLEGKSASSLLSHKDLNFKRTPKKSGKKRNN